MSHEMFYIVPGKQPEGFEFNGMLIVWLISGKHISNIYRSVVNNDKTEIILFGSKKHLAELNIKSLSVAGTDVSVASEPVRNLGAMFDSQLIMAPHVKSVVKKSSFHLRNIGKARRVLTEDATKTVMQSLVMSRLDYCNALLIGIQQDLIAKLQRLQNSAARIVSRTRKYEHITHVLIKLHWLPIKFRIQFKVLLQGAQRTCT